MELQKKKSVLKKEKKTRKTAQKLKAKLKRSNAAKKLSKNMGVKELKASEALPVVNDFRVLRVAVDEKRNAVRHWFLKKLESEKEKSTLVVVGIAPYVSKDCLERVFGEFGDVQEVTFQREVDHSLFEQSMGKGFQTAHVRFAASEHISTVMDQCHKSSLKLLFTKETPIMSGLSKWCSEYKTKFHDSSALKDDIDSYMADFDKAEEERKKEERKRRNQPDEEGWVTVTRSARGRVPPAVLATQKDQQKPSKKKRRIDESLNAFYSFQAKESKMKNLQDLRQKFDEDKKRLALLKSARKFRPL